MLDNIRASIKAEYDARLKQERANWEAELKELKQAAESNGSGGNKKNKDTAELQISFNEALKRAMSAKEAELEKLRDENRLLASRDLKEENATLKRQLSVSMRV